MDKIEELKKLLWILDSKHNVSTPQTKENIDYIAQEIVKLFCQPAVKIIWHNPESRKPLCYQSGDWDGKRSDNVLVELKNGNYVVAVCYEGIVDGCRFYDWYYGVDEWELTESEVRRWMKIPD